MTTSPTTSEHTLRERLLDVLYSQWYRLGVPFSVSRQSPEEEVLDPEALLWCSLEFLPTEPRLLEGVVSWLKAYESQLLRHRLTRAASADDPRTAIWHALIAQRRSGSKTPSQPCYGLDSASEVVDFCSKLDDIRETADRGHAAGSPHRGPCSALLRARDLLGSDVRHLLLVYLLAKGGGSRLKDVQRYSRYAYRSLSETAARWETAEALVVEHGYCRLIDPEPWHALLKGQLRKAVLVDWFSVFDALTELLRATARARRKGLSADSAVIASFRQKAEKALGSACGQEGARESRTVSYLQKSLRSS